MKRALALLLSTSLLTGGCGALPKEYDVLNTPERWFTQTENPAPAPPPEAAKTGWWQRFDDPLMAELATQLLAQNLDLKIAATRVEEARAVTNATRATWLPEISAIGTVSRTSRPIGLTSPASIAEGGFDATWELDIFGRTSATVSAAEARELAAMASADDVRQMVIAELARSVILWHQARDTIRTTQSLLKVQDEQISLFSTRANAGLSDASGLERARAQREQTATNLPLAEAAAAASHYQMERLLGKESGALATILATHEQASFRVPPPEATLEISLDTIRMRPDVRAARATMLAAQSDLAAAEANLWPRVTLAGFFGARDISGNSPSAGNPLWALAAGVAQPLLDFGRLRSEVDAADAASKRAALAYENTVLLALQEARTALSDYLNGINAVTKQQEAYDYRVEAVNLAGERFRHGLTDMTDLTTTETERDTAAITLIERRAEAAIAFIRLQKALGKG
jgi:NodT family efflux transporter outer membrane factor (OMF) lipoprotein